MRQQTMSISTDSLTSVLYSRTDVFSYESHARFFTNNIENAFYIPKCNYEAAGLQKTPFPLSQTSLLENTKVVSASRP